jgi:hypothetical protein
VNAVLTTKVVEEKAGAAVLIAAGEGDPSPPTWPSRSERTKSKSGRLFAQDDAFFLTTLLALAVDLRAGSNFVAVGLWPNSCGWWG